MSSPVALFAQQGSVRVDRAVAVEDGSPRKAVDRWQRLKSLYPMNESPTGQPGTPPSLGQKPGVASLDDEPRPGPQQPAQTQPVQAPPSKGQPGQPQSTYLPIPDEDAPAAAEPHTTTLDKSAMKPGEPNFDLPRRNILQKDLPPPRPVRVQPLIPLDEEPNWVLPAIIEREDDPTGTRPTEDAEAMEPDHIVPAPSLGTDRPATKTPLPNNATTAQLETEQVSHSQVTAVRYRKIGNIDPFLERTSNGQEVDQDIREWAKRQSINLDLATASGPFPERAFPAIVMPWEAPNYFHYPLYFEDPALERYGHTHHAFVQPLASIGRFGVQLLSLPYQMTIDPPCREVYSLGWYRPGECAPKLHYQVPLDAKAAVVQVATVTGLVFLVP